MKVSRIILTLSIIGLSTTNAISKPAMRHIRTVTQPDGTSLRINVVGDEKLHFTLTESGDILHLDPDGFYRLGKIEHDGAVISTGLRPVEAGAAGVAVNFKDIDLKAIESKRISKRRASQSGYGLSKAGFPTLGNPKCLIILVEYTDVKFNTKTPNYNGKDYFNEMINGENFTQFGGTGSAKQYFRDQSGGKFIPDFDVYGPVTLPKSQAYYGKNDWWGDDENAHLMITDAIDILNPDVNFADYDTDGDGVIDNVYVFYAGQGEADFGAEDTVWPHAWDVRYAGINKRVDGVLIGHYACSNEWDESAPNGIGAFIHEFSHVIGLPDLYNTEDGEANYTPDTYSVLDYGPYNNDGRTPPNYGAYEKNAMGWYEPIMLDRPLSITLNPIQSGEFGLIPTDKNTEFFLLENRQLEGWDKYIPNHGMLIWHIDYDQEIFDANEVNNRKNHQYVDIVEANNKQNYDFSDGYTFPGTSGKTDFTSTTRPALKSWSGSAIDFPITDIKEKDKIISFNVAGGGNNNESSIDFTTSENDCPVYFNLQGVRIDNPAKGTLVIKRSGNKVSKIIIE